MLNGFVWPLCLLLLCKIIHFISCTKCGEEKGTDLKDSHRTKSLLVDAKAGPKFMGVSC